MRKMEAAEKPEMTAGLDWGDRVSHSCLLNADGDVAEEGRIQSTEAALRRHFEDEPEMRIALECGTHSPWVSRLLTALGHQVIVANARKIPAITGSESKHGRKATEKTTAKTKNATKEKTKAKTTTKTLTQPAVS
jgi:transposase